VLVVEGIFLHRDELVTCWDFSIFLDVPFDVTASRMAERDGSDPDPNHVSMRRYVEGQRIYLRECDPRARADAVIDNTDPSVPVW
jgi:uridine kinase